MKVWYCHHSGVAVKTQRHLLLFDLFGEALEPKEGQGLQQGYFDPKKAEDQNTIVFVSHEHEDHFDPRIFSFRDKIKRIEYVLPEELDEIFSPAVFVHPHMQVNLPDCRITTLDSTDIGVAYLVETDGKLIYHAGDLNRWHWEGEEEAFNKDQELRYRREMEYLAKQLDGREIDLAFVPLDPRQEENCILGLQELLCHVRVKQVVPIHFWGDFTADRYLKGKEFPTKIVMPKTRGELILPDQTGR